MGSQPHGQVIRYREIRPEGADQAAAAFAAVAARVHRAAERFRGHLQRLDLTWDGRARDRFMDESRPRPNRLDELAETIEAQAGDIRRKTVTIEENLPRPM